MVRILGGELKLNYKLLVVINNNSKINFFYKLSLDGVYNRQYNLRSYGGFLQKLWS